MKTHLKQVAAVLLIAALLLPVGILGVFANEEEESAAVCPKFEANANWMAGKWEELDVYEVYTPQDLLAVEVKRGFLASKGAPNYLGKTIKLMADIDLNPGWDASSGTVPTNVWTSMFNFQGTFDGNGHTIKGLYNAGNEKGKNASFITNLNGGTIQNLKIENSAFIGTGANAAFVACVKHDAYIENVYVDAIVESEAHVAGGFIGWHFTTGSETPKSTLKNCVFAGSVKAKLVAGGFIGSVASYSEEGNSYAPSRTFEATLIDCVNYGTVTTSSDGNYAGGIIGAATDKTTLTRCYNAGVVSGRGKLAALMNLVQKETKDVLIEDCYFLEATDLVAMTQNEMATSVTVKYNDTAADAVATATIAELLLKDAFKDGWVLKGEQAVPNGVKDLLKTHTYTTKVTAPTCTEMGYTTYTCTDEGCSSTYNSDYTEMLPHTEGEEWIVDREPTTSTAGSRHKECTECHKILKSEVLKKLPAETSTQTETQAPAVTDAPTAEPTDDAKKEGCGSSIAAGATLCLTVLLSLGVASVRRKHD